MLPHENYKWKVEAKLDSFTLPQLKIWRAFILPHSLGVGEDGKWSWPWLPFKSALGLKITPKRDSSAFPIPMDVTPFIHLKALNPVLGKIALKPAFEILGNIKAEIRREFAIGCQAKCVIRASLELGNSFSRISDRPHWAIKLELCSSKFEPMEIVQSELSSNAFTFKYSQGFKLTKNSNIVSNPGSKYFVSEYNKFFVVLRSFLPQLQICVLLLIIEKLFTRENSSLSKSLKILFCKEDPLPTHVYSKALENFGGHKTITVIPGHYIDPGVEQGAPGEREFNLEIANYTETKLHAEKWTVLRPDRDAPSLSWNEYLNWVSRQSVKGCPVLEIHGQGSTADYRGLVYGIIGDTEAPLNQELAKEFGVFEMDWTGLGVPSRGGVIVESFNADEVLNLDPLQRTWAAKSIANRIVNCIQRASSTNSIH